MKDIGERLAKFLEKHPMTKADLLGFKNTQISIMMQHIAAFYHGSIILDNLTLEIEKMDAEEAANAQKEIMDLGDENTGTGPVAA